MGFCCSEMRVKERESDLPSPKIEGNAFERFELSLPFQRTWAETFAKRVRHAAAENKKKNVGDGTNETMDALIEAFITPAWEDLRLTNSRITKLIESPVFQNDNGEIDANKLIMFGFLNCPSETDDRSELLYGIFQEGG